MLMLVLAKQLINMAGHLQERLGEAVQNSKIPSSTTKNQQTYFEIKEKTVMLWKFITIELVLLLKPVC